MPVWTATALRLGKLAVPLLLRYVDPEKVTGIVQDRANAVTARRQAIRKAELSGGTYGAWIAEGRTRWVVFKDDEPIDIFPPITGALPDAVRHYDRTLLRSPDDRRVPATRRRVGEALDRLRTRVTRRDAGPVAGELPPGGGRAYLDTLADRLEPLLDELTSAPPGAPAPASPGVWLRTSGGAPVSVGASDDLSRDATGGEVRFAAVEDPVLRAVFEPYAAEVLGLPAR